MRRECIFCLCMLAAVSTAAPGRTYINCTTREVVIEGTKSSTQEKSRSFWLDDVSKTITFADGTPLTVTRFDDNWISANRGGVSYELDRRRQRLTYASSEARDRTIILTVGSGQCENGLQRP